VNCNNHVSGAPSWKTAMTKFIWASCFLAASFASTPASAKVVQSSVVEFPSNGRVIVQAWEEVGRFPSMRFVSEKTREVLLQCAIRDKDKSLAPENDELTPPILRFRIIHSSGFNSPLIMSVGVAYGGSDSAFFMTVFGEVQGKIKSLNARPFFANIQGGYYLGRLNDKLGYGLVTWNFIWGGDPGESHYSEHRYKEQVYRLQDGELKLTLSRVSRKKYTGNGSASLREIGIRVSDQRRGIPRVRDSLD